MHPIHLLLGASLTANALMVGGYFYTRNALADGSAAVSGATLLGKLRLNPDQVRRLQETRQSLRAELQTLRTEGLALFEAALAKVRAARPGDNSYEQALLATGEVRRRQTLIITRELIAFREHLTPAQREVYNRNIGEWAFIEAFIGLPPDGAKTPPSGPFRGASGAPPKNGR